MSFIRGKAYNGITFGLVSNLTGSGIDGGTAIAKITKDGAAAANLASNPTPLGSGLWTMNLTASETDAEFFTVSVHHPSAVYYSFPVKTTSSGNPMFANVTQINSLRTDGYNATLSLKQLDLNNSAGYGLAVEGTTAGARFYSASLKGMIIEGGGDDALYCSSSDGAGMHLVGTNRGLTIETSSGPGVLIDPHGGNGFEIQAAQGYYGMLINSQSGVALLASGYMGGISAWANQEDAMRIFSLGGNGLHCESADSHGAHFVGANLGISVVGNFGGIQISATDGHGFKTIGAGTGKHGFFAVGAPGSGDGMRVESYGSGAGFRAIGSNPLADIVADISGNLAGSISTLWTDASGAVRLASGENVYYADIIFHLDDTNSRDEYTVNWFRNGVPYSGGISNQKLWVVKRADGTDLIPPTGLASIGNFGAYKVDAYNTLRTTNGLGYLVQVWGDIDNQTRFWRRIVSRDVDT